MNRSGRNSPAFPLSTPVPAWRRRSCPALPCLSVGAGFGTCPICFVAGVATPAHKLTNRSRGTLPHHRAGALAVKILPEPWMLRGLHVSHRSRGNDLAVAQHGDAVAGDRKAHV